MNKNIRIELCTSGMSNEFYSEDIMIFKPFSIIHLSYSLEECVEQGVLLVSDLINLMKKEDKEKSFFGDALDECTYLSIYVKNKNYLLGLREDKTLEELFNIFKTDEVILTYIYVVGGASLHHHGYKFVVGSNEDIHKYSKHPHVHVIKDDTSVRYSIDTYERLWDDEASRAHIRDEKKIIKPFIKKKQDELMEYWRAATQGFVPPTLDQDEKQYYKES